MQSVTDGASWWCGSASEKPYKTMKARYAGEAEMLVCSKKNKVWRVLP